MRPEEWEHYIKQQWEQYENKQYIKQSDVKDWISDVNNLLYELRTRFWFAKHQKEFEKWNVRDLEEPFVDKFGKQIVDKFEQCCKAKELGEGIWLDNSFRVTEVARNTLTSLIAEMKCERPPPPPQEPQQPPPPKAPPQTQPVMELYPPPSRYSPEHRSCPYEHKDCKTADKCLLRYQGISLGYFLV